MEDIALRLVKAAIRAADPYKAVINSVRVEGNKLLVKDKEFEIKGKVYVLAFGKAACDMARAIEEILDVEDGVAVTKYGYGKELKKIRVIEAGHPIPDENSIRGAIEGLKLLEKVKEEDIVFVLISGGGSALFELPEDGISLEDLKLTNELLLKSGAKIHEINTVRKHISKVKGGKLAKKIKGTGIVLIISDVVGDNLEAIASGPTVKDPTTFQDAKRILELYGIWDRVPESVRSHIEKGIRGEAEETLKEELPNIHNFLIASNSISCQAVVEEATKLGFKAYVMTTTLEGEAKDAGLFIGSIVQEIAKTGNPFEPPVVLVFGGETTVTIEGEGGKGGPNQELALSATRKIKGLNAILVAFDTDGTDGPTDAAGGIVDGETYEKLRRKGIDIEKVLKEHNSYEALKKVGSLLFTGPTGTNVNSMIIAIITSKQGRT
ncbi:glycerate kinase type-2 family protein [Pyrococcus abyssi]|uniref:Glycerate kinase n=1 Tax=Pyrococcus abyssi (strain GE5 / Orsay) TaxID=272844 RepID=Q9UYG1_PYRAB|nr:glycerate kinase [Pyrococcus abyssi]CAB50451.1 Putative hydroxypyruvate reductase [Pyrococcus abyssi GE5]CCE71001.1 TPA: glycerate kinase [Pyrococcus abyssi GE5]